jgi:uncharacterized protein (AIM24 family)
MAVPMLMPTSLTEEAYAGVKYHIEGELVPALHIELGEAPVYFEHHILLWKHPAISVSLRPTKGALKRMMAGMQIFVTEASGQGRSHSAATLRGTSCRCTCSEDRKFTCANTNSSRPHITLTTRSSG